MIRTAIIETKHIHFGCKYNGMWEYRIINSVYCATAFSKKRYINMNYIWDNYMAWKHPDRCKFNGEILNWNKTHE